MSAQVSQESSKHNVGPERDPWREQRQGGNNQGPRCGFECCGVWSKRHQMSLGRSPYGSSGGERKIFVILTELQQMKTGK